MDNLENSIIKTISSFSQLPYLFVGTGMSIRYSNAPTWNNLLKNIWCEINEGNAIEYGFFIRKIEHELKLDAISYNDEERKYILNPAIASRISEQFNNIFYKGTLLTNKIFEIDDAEKIIKNKYDPFKYYISQKMISFKVNSDNEIDFLKSSQNKIAGVITTNYDNIIEQIFPDFEVLMGNESLLIANTENLFNVYKIHGCMKCPNTIIITTEDYKNFEEKLKYLSAKLLTLFVEHPIIFLGYSMSDSNIRNILQEISICLSNEQLEVLKDRFIFIRPAFGEPENISTRELIFDGKKIMMTEFCLSNYETLFRAISLIKSSMPVKEIRKMQDMYCKFIASTEATNNIFVSNLSNPNLNDKVAIYFGPLETVIRIGFKTYCINDIMEDILFDSKPYLVNMDIINETFKLIRSVAGKTYLPVYKFISKLGISIDDLPKGFQIIRGDNGIRLNSSEENLCKNELPFYTIDEIVAKFPEHISKQMANIQKNYKNFKVEELGDFLRKQFYDKDYREKVESKFKKLVALYDYMKYK